MTAIKFTEQKNSEKRNLLLTLKYLKNAKSNKQQNRPVASKSKNNEQMV
ncbi:MAG: hypothetical protein ACOVNU_03120 [Candidatus Kapaibacteriota bacterium]|jgi:hypothetical protein